MPTPFRTRAEIVKAIPSRIETYNRSKRGIFYNEQYARFVEIRLSGVRKAGLTKWLKTPGGGGAIRSLVSAFGMDARQSRLVPLAGFEANLSRAVTASSIESLGSLNLCDVALSKSNGNSTVAEKVRDLFSFCATPGHFSESGGFVIGTKVAHCVLPDLIPMIDTSHIGTSLYNISRKEYLPPGGDWQAYVGYQPSGLPNPSPAGGGRNLWKADQILCAMGFYTRVYLDWLALGERNNLQAFLALDECIGTTGIPRLLDKVLW